MHLPALLLVLGTVARAAPPALDDLEQRVDAAEGLLVRLDGDYRERRGLIGATEARSIYEDAVFDYLVGNYERAALAFYSLVEARAFDDHGLATDAEWYLAECLFELKNWNTALEAYDAIVAQGAGHPFYVDAVRRELEIYGILEDHDRFWEVYRAHVLSGRVPETDAVRYTVARSFWRQGEVARAKAMFSDIAPEGEFYGRARYHVGTILAMEGDYEAAIAEFRKVAELGDREDPEVVELAHLALGRLYYEIGDYASATEHYRQVRPNSPYFADELYEIVWTYIKQEQWTNALQHLEIFLLAFPDHPYTMQMRLLQGHLYMKQEAYEQALASYEGVVRDYEPLEERFARLEASREGAADFIRRVLAEDEDLDARLREIGLPAYAREMLVDDDAVARAVRARQELERQRADVERSQDVAAEVSEALRTTGGAIGTFNRGRAALSRVEGELLRVRIDLLGREVDAVADALPAGQRARADALRRRWRTLVARADELGGEQSAASDRVLVHDDQVREVQRVAGRVRQVAEELRSEVAALRRALSDRRASMDAGAVTLVEEGLDALDAELQGAIRDLERVQSDATRRRVMAAVPRAAADLAERGRADLARDVDAFRRELAPFTASLPRDWTREADRIWERSVHLAERVGTVRSALERAERQELELLLRRLREERRQVGRLGLEVADAAGEAEDLAIDVARAGLARLEGDVEGTVMRADMGIVDVYWLRKTAVSDELTRLAKERGLRMRDLDRRFDVIRQKLEE